MEIIKTIVVDGKKYSLSNDIPTWYSIEELIDINIKNIKNSKKLEIKKNSIEHKKFFRKKHRRHYRWLNMK